MKTRLVAMGIAVACIFSATSAGAVADHLQCFKVKDELAKAAYTATLTPADSTFPVAAGCEISIPAKLLCVNATKSAVSPAPPGSADGAPAQQYLCYKTKCPKSEALASATDQFGTHPLGVKSTSLSCAPLVYPVHCFDGVTSGDETDVDCGGSCRDCAIGGSCAGNSDCAIANCTAGSCSFPVCSDAMRNGDETDVDCGGSCGGCAAGLDCAGGDDCASGFCSNGSCSSCSGNADCAPDGYCSSGSCRPLVGEACSSGATCPSGFCVDGVCCDSACASTCEACSFAKKQSGQNGVCGPIASGTDPDSECAGTDACVGSCQPAASAVAGHATVAVPRTDSCGGSTGRLCESLAGNVVADGMIAATGTDFAIVNSGALRADLTCPAGGNANCDAYAPPPHVITAGQVLTVLPFASRLAVTTVTGDVLKAMLENGVSVAGAGRFPQLAGLCVTWDVALPAGSRVTGAKRTAPDGSCTGATVDLGVTGSYSVTITDFMAAGGDGYPYLLGSSTLDVSDWTATVGYLGSQDPVSPAIHGRIACTDSNGATAPNCPP